MKKYLLALLFVFASSPCFSTDDKLEEVYEAFRGHVSQPLIEDRQFIDYLETLKRDHKAIYTQFLRTKDKRLSIEIEGAEYPTHLAMTQNRPQLFNYLLDNEARLSYRFKDPIKHLSGYFKDIYLSEQFIPLVGKALTIMRLPEEKINEFFSRLYQDSIPDHIRYYEERLKSCKIKIKEGQESLIELASQLRESQDAHTTTKEQRDRLNLEKQKLEEDFLQREKILQEMSEKLLSHTNNLLRKKEVIELLEREKVEWLEQQKKFAEEAEILTKENVLTKKQYKQLGLQYKRLEADHLEREEILRQRAEEIRKYREELETNEHSIKLFETQKSALLENQERFTQHVKDLEKRYALVKTQYTELGVDHVALQDTLREKDNTLELLDKEKVDLTEGYRQLAERESILREQHFSLNEQYNQLGINYNVSKKKLQEKNDLLLQKKQILARLNREKVDLAEQYYQLTEQHAQLGLDHRGLQDTLREKDHTLLERQWVLDENRVSLERLNAENADWAEQHRELTERQQHLQEKHDSLTEQHTQLGLRHTGLQDTLREKDHILSERQRVLEENRVALGTLNTEKTDLAGQYRQAVLAAKTLENNIALLEKQNAASEVQLRILQEKSLPQSPEVKEKVTVVSSHEASTPLSIKNSLGASDYKTDSSSEATLVLPLENQKTVPLHLVTHQAIVEGNIAEQAMEARRALSSQYSKKYARVASQQTKAEIAQTESMEQLKIEEEKANLAFEKNKRAETDRQLLEMQIESKRNRN